MSPAARPVTARSQGRRPRPSPPSLAVLDEFLTDLGRGWPEGPGQVGRISLEGGVHSLT